MRLFGRITRFIQISRCLGYHAPHFRPRSLLGANRLLQLCGSSSSGCRTAKITITSTSSGHVRVQRYSQKNNNVFNITEISDMLRKRISFSGAPNTAAQILPVGLITPEAGDDKDLKIVIVPLNLSGMDANSLKETLEAINQLRMYAHHIEAFSSSMVDDYNALNEAFQEVGLDKQEQAKSEASASGDNVLWDDYTSTDAVGTSSPAADVSLGASTPLQRQAAVGCLQNALGNAGAASSTLKTTKAMSAMAQPSTSRSSAVEADLREAVQDGDIVEEVQVDVPQDLSDRLNDMAVSSMELSFEMDMTSLRDALASKDGQAVTHQEPMICMHTKVEMNASGATEKTIPLRFNALISGVVELDARKLNISQITEDQMPGFNDDLTSLAANLCSTALEKGFSATASDTISDLEFAKDKEAKAIDMSLMTPGAQVGEMLRTADQPQGNYAVPVEVPVPTDKDGCKHPPVKPKRKCPGKCPLIDDPCKDDPCKRPEKKPKKKALSTTQITAMAKDGGKDPCKDGKGKDGKGKDGKGKDGKKDPCAKFKKGGKDGKDGKDGKGGGKDPCAKDKKKDDPCAKDKKKDDPCAKDKKKDDPCAKDKKKEDPCAKDKKKEDPCAKDKKKKDPCGKGKDGKGKDGKKDPCGKDGKGKDGKGKDGKGKDGKKDPCGKDGKGKDGKGKDGKKKDPCAKFKKDGGKDGKDGKGGKNKCAKFSTFARNQNPSKRYLSTALNQAFREPGSVSGPVFFSALMRRHYRILSCRTRRVLHKSEAPPRFIINSTFLRRRFGGLTGKFSPGKLTPSNNRSYADKKKKSGGKCGNMATKYPKSRGKDIKERTGLREDCFNMEDGGCGVKSCTGKCSKVKFPKKKCDRSKKDDKDDKVDRLLSNDAPLTLQLQHRSFGTQARVLQLPYDSGAPKESLEGQAYALRISEAYKVNLVPVSRPTPKDFDVLIRTGSVAISGSDIHVYENGNRDVEAMSLGHDATGFVEEVGRSVHHLHVGDRVVVESALSCSICDLCKQGLYNMCAGLVYNGFLSTFQLHPADLCHRLHPSISMEEGALTQTLALGCQACFKGNITPTSNVLILGTCPTAVAAGICAQAMGAKRVTMAGCMGAALEVASRDFGFDAVEFDSNALFGEVLEAIYSKFQAWPNCVINCSISAMSMNLAVMALEPCGVCVLAECDSECASFNALDVLMKNIRLIPSFRSANMYPTALQLMRSGRAPMKNFITARYPLSQAEEAFRLAQHESNMGLGKVIVNCAEDASVEENRRNSE